MYKKIFEGKKAAIFDLDGTIVKETLELRKQAYEKVLEELELSYIDPRPYCSPGYPSSTVWEAILEANDIKGHKVEDLVEKTRESYLEIIKKVELETTEGFWELFNELKDEKNFQLALVTNSPRNVQNIVMEKLGIKGKFDVEIFGDDVKKCKPDPEIFKKALKELKVKRKEAVIFEDSVPGVEAAKAAKIDTLVIWDGETIKSLYGNTPLEFSSDFAPYPGNLDETHEEYLLRSFKQAMESRK